MLRTGMYWAGGVLALAVLVMGPRAVWSHVQASRDVVKGEVERRMPDAELLARLRLLVKQLSKSGDSYRADLMIVQRKHDQLAEDQASVQRQLDTEKTILSKAKATLESGLTEVSVGGRSYSIEQVRLDCKTRLSNCQRLESDLAIKSKALATLATTLARGKQQLAELETLRKSKLSEIDSLETRLQNAGMLAQVNAWTDRLQQSPEGLGQEFAGAVDELQRRVFALEAEADAGGERRAAPGVIDWTEPQETARDLAGEIDRYLGGKKGQVATAPAQVPATEAKPIVEEASGDSIAVQSAKPKAGAR